MSKADDYYSVINEVNKLLVILFETESKQDAWYYYPCYKGLNGLIPATLMRKNIAEARKVRDVLLEMDRRDNE